MKSCATRCATRHPIQRRQANAIAFLCGKIRPLLQGGTGKEGLSH
jgi:hypothetical protein